MTQQEYDQLQATLSLKLQFPPREYNGSHNKTEAYKAGILAAKSILSSYFKQGGK